MISVSLILLLAWSNLFAEEPKSFYGDINADNINIRSDSTVSSPVICNLNKGQRLEVISEYFGWYKIRLPKNAAVYVKKNFFECIKYKSTDGAGNPLPIEKQKSCSCATASKSKINVRFAPTEVSAILGRIENNEVINIISDSDGWYKIEPPQKSFGWINKKFLNKATAGTILKQKNQAEKNATLTKENPTLYGIVQPYGRIIGRKATHKLISEDKIIYLLKGNKSGLNALNYRKIKVSGKITGSSSEGYPIVEIATIEAIN